MRHILRLVLFAILLALATSANAQECSIADQPEKTWNQVPADPVCGVLVEGKPFTVYSTTVDTCMNKNNGIYAQSVRQVTGIGEWQCSNFTPLDLKCNPTITQQVTHATSPSDYNHFYLRAWDANPAQYCGVFVIMSRQDFWQCSGLACICPGHNTCTSPIILDLNGKGFDLTNAANGVSFDCLATARRRK
jgi:hypothetical protein